MKIETVKILPTGWLVNGITAVTDDPEAAGYAEVQAWLINNIPIEADPPLPPSNSTIALGDAKQWLDNNSGARLIWELSVEDLETEIINHIAALYPTATNAQKNKERLFRMTIALLIRREAKQLGLVD